MSELGDLGEFLKEGSGGKPVDLDWLDVDEKAYQELDRLPKQNLDVVPDLVALWSHTDAPASNFVPNKGEPKTMGDLSQTHGLLRKAQADILRAARLAVTQTTDPNQILHLLTSRFDSHQLKYAQQSLSEVFAERGLLGRYYVDSSDFPDCASGSKSSASFVRKFAAEARFLKAKSSCLDCRHRQGGSGCSVFNKRLVASVPYTEALAVEVEGRQRAAGRVIQASKSDPRTRIKQAFLAEAPTTRQAFTGQPQAAPRPLPPINVQEQLIAIGQLTRKKTANQQQVLATQKARPIVAMLRKELLRGRTREEVAKSLRLAFDERMLVETAPEWKPLYNETGIFGAVYSSQESFDDCREGADFLAKHGTSVRAIVAGPKCESCIFSKVSRCMLYGKKLIASSEEILTPETVRQVISEHRVAGRLPYGSEARDWGSTPAEALQAVHEAAMAPKVTAATSTRARVETIFRGSDVRSQSENPQMKRMIVQAVHQYMNEGLYGQDLVKVLQSRFEVRDMKAAEKEIRAALVDQGLQGIVFVDPRVYNDYGNGCKEAARKHRTRTAVRYAKIGDKCGSCVHHTRPGVCSVLSKQLVKEPPYMDKVAQQRAILSSGLSTEVPYESLMHNGLSMMEEYQLQNNPVVDIDIPSLPKAAAESVMFGNQEIKL